MVMNAFVAVHHRHHYYCQISSCLLWQQSPSYGNEVTLQIDSLDCLPHLYWSASPFLLRQWSFPLSSTSYHWKTFKGLSLTCGLSQSAILSIVVMLLVVFLPLPLNTLDRNRLNRPLGTIFSFSLLFLCVKDSLYPCPSHVFLEICRLLMVTLWLLFDIIAWMWGWHWSWLHWFWLWLQR